VFSCLVTVISTFVEAWDHKRRPSEEPTTQPT
jgi:hypothetical protein